MALVPSKVFRTRLTWVVVGGILALSVAGVVDALLGSSETGRSLTGDDGVGSARLTESTTASPPRCTSEQIAISIDTLGGVATIAVRHARGPSCHLTALPVYLKMWDRAGDRVRLVTPDENPEGRHRVAGDFSPGFEQLVTITYLLKCNQEGPFLAVATVGSHVARRTLSGDEVDCFRGG